MSNVVKFIIAVGLPLLVGFAGSYFTITGVNSWYATINKPSWNPPNSVFGPVWTTLYILMGLAWFIVWKSDAPASYKNRASSLFIAQLILNFCWSFIFFNRHEPGWAFAEIVVLWLFILFTIFAFAQVSKLAAWLLVPYISWVSFAAILNYTIWQLNK